MEDRTFQAPGRTDSVIGQVMSMTIFFMTCFGVWPRGEGATCSLYSLVIAVTTPACVIISTSLLVSSHEVETTVKFTIACTVFGNIPIQGNALILLFRHSRFQELVKGLRTFYEDTLCQITEGPLRHVVATERKLSVTFFSLCMFSIVGMIFGPIINYYTAPQVANTTTTMTLPIEMYRLWDEVGDPVFVTLYLLQTVVCFVGAALMSVTEGFFFLLILYTAHQFETISLLIKNVDRPDSPVVRRVVGRQRLEVSAGGDEASRHEEDVFLPTGDSRSRREAQATRMSAFGVPAGEQEKANIWCTLVAHHQTALRNCDSLRELLETPLLLHYSMASLEISIILYQINVVDDSAERVKFLLFIVTILIRLFIISYLGTKLITKSLDVGESLTTTNWYDYSQNDKKIILTMMCRAQRPVELWAGKFVIMSLETYQAILETAYSYFNILNTLN